MLVAINTSLSNDLIVEVITMSNMAEGKRRILHTMLRVGDIDKSIAFYTKVLGMKLLRTQQQKSEGYTLAFLGYGNERETCVLELTYNYDKHEYDIGTAYGHIAIGVQNISHTITTIKNLGGEFSLEATPLKGSNEIIAFMSDPDGYQIELIERSDI